jgi:hypothetical protein
MLLHHNSFIVNTEDADSTNFNQIKGKVINGYFKDNKLNSMFVDGNAESVYYVKEDSSYTGLNHLVSGRLKILLDDNKLRSITAIRAIDASVTPMQDLKEEERVLKGFIWKPKDRPKSKDEIIPKLVKKEVKSEPIKKIPVKAPVKSSKKKNAAEKTNSQTVNPKAPIPIKQN